MADCRGELLRRELVSADFLSDWAIRFGSFHVNTPSSRSRALLCWVTSPDQYFLPLDLGVFLVLAFGNELSSFTEWVGNSVVAPGFSPASASRAPMMPLMPSPGYPYMRLTPHSPRRFTRKSPIVSLMSLSRPGAIQGT